jgi:integrase
MKKALDFAVKMGLLNANPIGFVQVPKIKKYDANYYTVEQLDNLITITKGTIIESAVYLTVHCGFRRGEILGLRWQDIDFKEGVLKVRNTRTRVATNVEKRPKSESSIRTLPLIPRVNEYLKALKEQQEQDKNLYGNSYKESDYVCRYEDGTPVNVNTIDHVFKRILANNNMPHIRFHDLRHSTACYLIKNGSNLKDIQVWLGHSDISITANIYAHVDAEMKRNTATKIDELFKAV